MNSNHIIETKSGEWLMAYNPTGNVCHFTRNITEAKRVCMEYGPSAEWARKARDVARRVYQRTEARIVNG
jgi:hypothetical protein